MSRANQRGVAAALLGCVLIIVIALCAPAASAAGNAAMAWGDNTYGELGVEEALWTPPFCNGEPVCQPEYLPVRTATEVVGLDEVSSIAAGYSHTLALLENGTVEAWGENEVGQLGLGEAKGPEECYAHDWFACASTPRDVPGLAGVKAVATGGMHSLALLANGTVEAWGDNYFGQLGNGTYQAPETCELPHDWAEAIRPCATHPEPVPGLTGVKAIAAGEWDSFALLENGTVMAWGRDEWGELGIADDPQHCGAVVARCDPTPTPITGLSNVKAIAAGASFTLALEEDGTVAAFGLNDLGELGDGGEEPSYTPVTVSGLTGVSQIGAGVENAVALLGDGTLMAWGDNSLGQLGVGSVKGPERCSLHAPHMPCSTVPVAVPGVSGAEDLAVGYQHALALLENGTVMAWGYNEEGALGTEGYGPESCEPPSEAPRCSTSPVPVPGLTGVRAIAVNAGSDDSVVWGPLTPTVTGIEGEESGGEAAAPPARDARSNTGGSNTGSETGGTTVTIKGSDFSGTSAVHFGESEAESFSVLASGRITAITPPGTGTVDVTVTTDRGVSGTGAGDHFTYVPPERPTVTRLKPSKGASTGGRIVTISGSGLAGVTSVSFGDTIATSIEHVGSTIRATAPAGAAGTATVTVTSPEGTSVPSAASTFTYKGVTVTSVTPSTGSSAGGQRVLIAGSGFATGLGATTILFGKTAATAVECPTTTSCEATVPGGTGKVSVVARVGAQKSKKSVVYSYA